MEDFDKALIGSAFTLAGALGWSSVSVAEAARAAGLKLDQARERFPTRLTVLMKFGQMADQHALTDMVETGPVRERIFDTIMRRFDVLQQHRAGVLALLRALPADPGTTLLLAGATGQSMGWMLEAAGVPSTGWRGAIATQALAGVWLYVLRAWTRDDSPDLSGTMAALDRALSHVEQVAGLLDRAPSQPETGPAPFPEDIPGDTLPGAALPDPANSI